MDFEKQLQKVKEYLEAEKVGFVDFERQKDVFDSYEIIREIVTEIDPEATIEIKHSALQTGSMAISVTTSDLTVYDMKMFSKSIEKADNFQICPTTDERITFDILFEDVITYFLI
jgi:hypothetical protein